MSASPFQEFTSTIEEIKNLIESKTTDSIAYLAVFKKMRHATSDLEDAVMTSIHEAGKPLELPGIDKLKFYYGVSGSTFTIKAHNEAEAEEKYNAHFDSETPCPCGVDDCDCVDYDDGDCDHIMVENGEV